MTVSFNPAKNFEVGRYPHSVTVGDFNGDGKNDLAASNQADGNISVLLGDGNGGFSAAQNFEVGRVPGFVTVGDFNGDGKDDLVAYNQTDGSVSVLLGDGSGGFSAAQNFDVGLSSLIVGDFNGDGKDDLAGLSSGSVSVLLGDGSGGFSASQNFDVGDKPGSLAVGDFNGDGRDDLATTNFDSDNISVLLGDGSGGFSAAQNFAVVDRPRTLTVGDFNGDGRDDLAVGGQDYKNNLSVLLQDASGSFTTAQNFAAGNSSISSIEVGDFNGDGKDDLATDGIFIDPATNSFIYKVWVFSGDGSGGFSSSQNFEVGSFPDSIAVGDFNNDGKDDLATVNQTSDNNISVLTTRDNNAPTDLNLSNDTIAENNSFNAEVGTFTTTDPNTNDTFTYELVTGEGDTDNSSFSINGDKLTARDSFDFETQSSYNIRVKTTDSDNESFEKTLAINVSDLSEVPEIRTVTDNGNEMEIIDLTGNAGQTVIANFEIDRDADYDNNVYFYKVDGDDGNIGGLSPDDSGYLQTALNNVVNPDFGLNADKDAQNETGSLNLEGGDILGVVIVADGTLEQAISNIDSVEGVYLSYMGAGASTDNGTFDHIRFNSNTSTFEFEDLANGGDQDFDDIKVKIEF